MKGCPFSIPCDWWIKHWPWKNLWAVDGADQASGPLSTYPPGVLRGNGPQTRASCEHLTGEEQPDPWNMDTDVMDPGQ